MEGDKDSHSHDPTSIAQIHQAHIRLYTEKYQSFESNKKEKRRITTAVGPTASVSLIVQLLLQGSTMVHETLAESYDPRFKIWYVCQEGINTRTTRSAGIGAAATTIELRMRAKTVESFISGWVRVSCENRKSFLT